MSLVHFENKIKEKAPKRKEEVAGYYAVGVVDTQVKIDKMKNKKDAKQMKSDIKQAIAMKILRPKSASKPMIASFL